MKSLISLSFSFGTKSVGVEAKNKRKKENLIAQYELDGLMNKLNEFKLGEMKKIYNILCLEFYIMVP